MSVVFPKPLSPFDVAINTTSSWLTEYDGKLTNYHDREVRPLLGHDLVFLKSMVKTVNSILMSGTNGTVTWLGRLAIPIPPAGSGADMFCEGKRGSELPKPLASFNLRQNANIY